MSEMERVVDVTDSDFERVVVEGSEPRPVVVDLWAEWCGPCRMLGPILEKMAEERGGAFLLARLDVDANPLTAQRFGVQSIPTVIAFRGGEPVDGFIGALPEQRVNEFIDRILPPEGDTGEGSLARDSSGDPGDAEDRFRRALDADPNDRAARLGLGRILSDRGEADEARRTLMPLLPDAEVERLLASIEVSSWASVGEPGTLASAKRLAAQGEWRAALDGMLGALRDDPEARQAMLEVFAVLGDDDDLVAEYRRRLASALF